MKLIVGLGNPGRQYADSRHNIGFQVARALLKEYCCVLRRDSATRSFYSSIRIKGERVIVALPLTFMNLSGTAVAALVRAHRLKNHDLLVVCDDMNLEFGRLKIRPSGSSGGHKGLGSIIDALGSMDFCRLRIGVGKAPAAIDASDYVLSSFTKKERKALPAILEESIACCRTWVEEGIDLSMGIFNRRKNQEQ